MILKKLMRVLQEDAGSSQKGARLVEMVEKRFARMRNKFSVIGGIRLPLVLWVVVLMCLGSSLRIFASSQVSPVIDEKGRHMPVLQGGWFLWDPYQFVEMRSGGKVLTGFDVELTRAIARAAGFEIKHSYRPWGRHIAEIRSGEADIASGATWSAERAEFGHFSRPYRQEIDVLYLPRGEAARYAFGDVPGMLRTFRETGFRLGIISGFTTADAAINAYISDPANAERIVVEDNHYENFRDLIIGRTDGILADRLGAATCAWRGGWRELVEEHPLRIATDVHFLFSKKTVQIETVHRFDEAIAALEANGETRRVIHAYLAPIVLAQTIDKSWFKILDIIGTIAFALSGVLIAVRERYSLFGALLLATLPAVGGGIVRDLLVGRETLTVLASPIYLGLVGATVLAGFLVIHSVHLARRRGWLPDRMEARIAAFTQHRLVGGLYEVSDAVGIAVFTVSGVAVAVSSKTTPIWLWGPLLATLTAAGGGILRDVVRQSGNIASLRGEFYAEVPMIWGLLLSLCLVWQTPRLDPNEFILAVIITMVGAFATRMTAVLLRLRSPQFPVAAVGTCQPSHTSSLVP